MGMRYIHRIQTMRLTLLAAIAYFAIPAQAAPEQELKDAAGKPIVRYVVEAPLGLAPAGTADPARQVGLFLCFPEHDHLTGDELLPVRESLRRQGLTDQYVLLAAHPQAQKFGSADHEPIRQLIEWAQKTYPINPRRIYMYGKGEGAKISAEFGTTHPNLITAGITYSWGWWIMPSELEKPLDPLGSAPEFYMVLGMRDLATHIVTVRDTYSRVKAKGYHVIYHEFDDLGGRTYHPASNDDAIAWATRLRNKNVPLAPGEKAILKSPAKPVNGYFEGIALVGGASAGVVLRDLLKSKDPAIRAAAVETCSRAIFDEATIAALADSSTDAAPKVRAAAFRALAMNAQWRSAAAQKILIDLAANPAQAINPADRMSAVDGLGQTVKFQIKGVRQDPPVFKELVALLDDKNEDVRVMAANILEPIRDSDFRGDSGRPERKAPEGGWNRWLDDITAEDAGYGKDYEVCHAASLTAPVDLFCKGGEYLAKQPKLAFQNTLQAAEQGYVPAEAAVAMMYANGKGVQQDYVEAGKWWSKAAVGGHALAAKNAARVPKANFPLPPNATLTQ